MRNRSLNRARNVWDRAVTVLPRVDQLWCKYIDMEEVLGNVVGARQIFERWMDWMADSQGWISYVNFELRYGEAERARAIFERLVQRRPSEVKAWIKFAKFEMKNGEVGRARDVYERAAMAILADDDGAEELYIAFAEFQVLCKEVERARCIYKYGLNHLPNAKAGNLYHNFLLFERLF